MVNFIYSIKDFSNDNLIRSTKSKNQDCRLSSLYSSSTAGEVTDAEQELEQRSLLILITYDGSKVGL